MCSHVFRECLSHWCMCVCLEFACVQYLLLWSRCSVCTSERAAASTGVSQRSRAHALLVTSRSTCNLLLSAGRACLHLRSPNTYFIAPVHVCVQAMIVWQTISRSAEDILAVSAQSLVAIIGASLILHVVFLVVSFILAR
jgi:hypothetical protein